VVYEAVSLECVLEPPPVMWNGFEYWKMVLSASSVIWMPYVASLPRAESTLHENLWSALSAAIFALGQHTRRRPRPQATSGETHCRECRGARECRG